MEGGFSRTGHLRRLTGGFSRTCYLRRLTGGSAGRAPSGGSQGVQQDREFSRTGSSGTIRRNMSLSYYDLIRGLARFMYASLFISSTILFLFGGPVLLYVHKFSHPPVTLPSPSFYTMKPYQG
jgi:hypothetical protein